MDDQNANTNKQKRAAPIAMLVGLSLLLSIVATATSGITWRRTAPTPVASARLLGGWVDDVGGPQLKHGSTSYPKRKYLTVTGATITDDATTNQTTIAIDSASNASPVADLAALRALSTLDGTVINGQSRRVGADPTPWIYNSASGAGFADDALTVVKPGDISLGSNGRWYKATSSPVLPTIAALRLAVAGVHDSVSVQAYSALGDRGGDIFDRDPADTTSTDNACTIVVAGATRWKRRFSGAIRIEWCGPSTSNLGTALNLAIAALPSGTAPPAGGTIDLRGLTSSAYTIGTTVLVDRPVELVPGKSASFTCTANPCVDLRANFRMHGNDRAVKWQSASNGTLFSISHTIAGSTAEPNIELSNLWLAGNGASSIGLDTTSAVITEGRILIDNNKIGGFGTGLNFATSVYYNTVLKNYFSGNGTSVVVGNSANSQIFENQFVGGTGDQIKVLSFGTKIVNNEFLGSSAYPSAADILFYPDVDSSDGGFSQVHGNNFFGENEGLNPHRRRIQVSYPTSPGYSSPPVEVTGNMFIGMAQKAIASATVNGGTHLVTFNVASGHGIPNGETANVHVFNSDNPTYDGKFTVTATDSTHFTVTCTRTTGTCSACGLVVNGDTTAAIGFSNPPLKWLIDDNQFGNFGVIVDDAYATVPAITIQGSGKSVFGAGNRVSTGPFSFAPKVFSGSGKGFERVDPPAGLDFTPIDANPSPAPTKLENQLLYSETWSNAAWVVSAGVTKTGSQTDPFGGTAGVLVDSTGTGGAKSIHQIYTATGGATEVVEFWAKAAAESDGSSNSSVLAGIFDNTTGAFQEGSDRIRLGTSWKKYRMVFTGITIAHSLQIDFRASGNTEIPAHFYLAFPQLSDAPSEYVATTSSAVSTQTFAKLSPSKQTVTGNLADATTGGALKSVLAALSTAGILTDSSGTTKPTVTGAVTNLSSTGALKSLLSTLATAGLITDSSTAMGTPSVTSDSGFGGAGKSVAMDAGSTDRAGSITITVGAAPSTSGDITVTFGTAYAYPVAPIILTQLSKSNTEWPAGTEPLEVKAISDTDFSIVWRSTVLAGQTFSINWAVVER